MGWRRTTRIYGRLTRALGYSFVAYGGALLSGWLLAPWPRASARWQMRSFQFWSRALVRVFGVRLTVVGEPPRPPFFLVANHLSYVDIVVLGTQLPCVFVAKAEIDRWPVFGAICRVVNTIFIDRKLKRDVPRAIALIREALAVGKGIVVFAESTSSAGAEVMPFRSPLLDLPVKMGLPVHYAVLGYRTPEFAPPAFSTVCWWGNAPFAPHVKEFLALPRVEARLVFGDQPVAIADRKQLAERLRSEVAARFEPTVGAEELAKYRPPWREDIDEFAGE
ncbi:MAG: lysophospholipid acyltransferase family protein [Thermoanaerobaculia bacterium]